MITKTSKKKNTKKELKNNTQIIGKNMSINKQKQNSKTNFSKNKEMT